MSRQYISDVAAWSQAYGLLCSEVEESVVTDEGEDFLTYRVKFASGFEVVGLPSRPTVLRSKKGEVRIDEAAFHEDLEELLKAAIAATVWGFQVSIWSTHNGVDNFFNKLIDEVERGDRDWSHHRYDLDDALADGLYQRICFIGGIPWTLEGEFEWRKQLIRDYGILADEELLCIPRQKGAGIFDRTWFPVIDEVPGSGRTVRFWDLAATAKDAKGITKGSDKGKAFYTAGTKMIRLKEPYRLDADHLIEVVVINSVWEQRSPSSVIDLMLSTAQLDGVFTSCRWELEGGSAGKFVEEQITSKMKRFDAAAIKPMGDKITRASPFGSAAMRGEVALLRGSWNEEYLGALQRFDGTPKVLVNDLTDSSSGAYHSLYHEDEAAIVARKLAQLR